MRLFKRWTWKQIFTVGLVFGVTGCAGLSGINGTTLVQAKYDSQVMADGTDHTLVDINLKGKAGDVAQVMSNASLMTKDATGAERNMTFGNDASNDATRRADSIDNAVNKRFETWQSGFAFGRDIGGQVIGAAAPILGAHVAAKDANEATKIQNQFQFRSQLLQAMPELAQLSPLIQMMPQLTAFFQNPNVLRLLNNQPIRTGDPVVTQPPATQPPAATPTPEPAPPVVTQPETPLTDGTLPAGTPIPVPNN